MPKLIINEIGHPGESTWDLNSIVHIGRNPENELQLEGEGISRKHAQIIPEGENFYLVDLQSANGTLLNGIAIKPREKIPLKNNDRIQIEHFRLRFVSQEELLEEEEEKTDADILEVKLLKKVLDAVDQDKLPSLEVLNGSAQGKRFFLTDDMEEMLIGREPTCDLAIDEFVISRNHAKIVKKWGSISIIDLESKNGTFINNRKVTEETLHDGDRVALGTILFLFRNPKEINIRAISEAMEQEKAKEEPKLAPLSLPENEADDANRETEEMLKDLPPLHTAPANIYPKPQSTPEKKWSPFELGMIGLGVAVFCLSLLTLVNLILE